MNVLLNLVVALQIIAALVMIGLVLIQHGKGADMGASFGSGASGSLFGATGSANFLSRSTAACAGVFFVCTLALAFFSNDRARPSTGSVLDRPAIAGPAASAAPTGAAQIPGSPGAPGTVVPVPAQSPATTTGTGTAPSGTASPGTATPSTAASAAAVPAPAASGAAAIPK